MEDILSPFIERFKDYLLLRNKSLRTAREYGYDLQLFRDFLKSRQIAIKNIDDIDETHIEQFLIYLRNERRNSKGLTLSPGTVNRKLFALRSFFRFLIKKRYYKGEDPTKYIDPINTTTLDTHTYLSPLQARMLCDNAEHNPRNALMIKLMLLLGLRVSEVANLNLSDINLDTLTITVHGKGNKERVLPLSSELVEAIREYLAVRPKDGTNALFVSRNHRRISVRRIQAIVNELVDKLEFNKGKEKEPSRKKITCHKLRHTFGTLAAQAGVDIFALKELMGHSSIQTTQIYTKASSEQLKKAVENHPIYNFKRHSSFSLTKGSPPLPQQAD